MRSHRIAALAAAALSAASLALATSATSASASAPAQHHGAKPITPGAAPLTAASANTLSLQTNSKTGAVSPTPKVYLVFWGSQWSRDPAHVAPDMQALFKGLFGSADTWGTILSQYCENAPAGTTRCP